MSSEDSVPPATDALDRGSVASPALAALPEAEALAALPDADLPDALEELAATLTRRLETLPRT